LYLLFLLIKSEMYLSTKQFIIIIIIIISSTAIRILSAIVSEPLNMLVVTFIRHNHNELLSIMKSRDAEGARLPTHRMGLYHTQATWGSNTAQVWRAEGHTSGFAELCTKIFLLKILKYIDDFFYFFRSSLAVALESLAVL
jgi:hypothetical protein